jgi:hypothetical protein
VSYYRLYFLNAEGRFARFAELFSEDDESAIAEAGGHADGRPMELWSRGRLVACLTADGAWTLEPRDLAPE